MGRNTRESPRQHLVRDRAPRLGAGDIGERERAAVTVGGRTVLTKLDGSIHHHRCQRRANRKRGLGVRSRFARGGQERDLDSRETNLAPVLQDETAPVADGTNFCRAGRLETAGGHRPAFRARERRRQHDGPARPAAKSHKRDVPAPAHAATKPFEWGGTTAVLLDLPGFLLPSLARWSYPVRTLYISPATRRGREIGR